MPISRERFETRFAGSAFQPLKLRVENADKSIRDLTGDTATLTLRKARGTTAVVTALGNTNTPGTAGEFEFQLTAAQVQSPGEYVATVTMMLGGVPEVGRLGLTLEPAT